jgi:chaperonin GroEL (HSP60 family)
VHQVIEDDNTVDIDNIKIEKKVGGGIEESELVKGIVLDKERVIDSMPKKVEKAKVALINSALEVKSSETDAKIQITDPSQLQAFVEQEEKVIKEMCDTIINSGATAVFCQKGIDDIAQYYLAKAGVYAVRRVKKSDMEKLAKATGAKLVTKVDELTKDDLGYAGKVEAIKQGDEDMTYVTECKNPKAVTFFIRGGTQHVVDEVERAVKDALGDIVSALQVGKVVAGAGAPEIEIAKGLREYATKLSGREQLAVQAFAESMEIVPRTLAENAGLDPIDMLTELKAKHDGKQKWAGIDVFKGKVVDAWKMGVIEPLKIKTQAVKSASEVAELILRIDDVIAGSSSSKEPQMPPGGMGGMGGMPGMM